MIGSVGGAIVQAFPGVERGNDVERRERADAFGRIEREAIRDPSAAIVAGHAETLETE